MRPIKPISFVFDDPQISRESKKLYQEFVAWLKQRQGPSGFLSQEGEIPQLCDLFSLFSQGAFTTSRHREPGDASDIVVLEVWHKPFPSEELK